MEWIEYEDALHGRRQRTIPHFSSAVCHNAVFTPLHYLEIKVPTDPVNIQRKQRQRQGTIGWITASRLTKSGYSHILHNTLPSPYLLRVSREYS